MASCTRASLRGFLRSCDICDQVLIHVIGSIEVRFIVRYLVCVQEEQRPMS